MPAAATAFETREYEHLPIKVWLLSALMVVIGIAAFIFISTRGHSNGYLYLFFYSIPANTAISLFPHEPILIYYGSFANIWNAAVAATGGTLVAGWLDYHVFVPVLNYKKITAYKDSRFYKKATGIFMRYPFATIIVTGFTPIPFFPFKFLCFSIHYPLYRYLSALTIGRFPRYAGLAWVGMTFEIPNWILIGLVIMVFSAYGIRGGPTVLRSLREANHPTRSTRCPKHLRRL
jgi:membrane protein YqaA with SNARE-associated domain